MVEEKRDVLTVLEDIADNEEEQGIEEALVDDDGLTSASAGQSTFFVFPVTETSVPFDLSGGDYTKLYEAIQAGKQLELQADYDLWYRWDTVTGTVDETKTATDTPRNQARAVFASERLKRRAPLTAKFLMLKGEVATYLRISILD